MKRSSYTIITLLTALTISCAKERKLSSNNKPKQPEAPQIKEGTPTNQQQATNTGNQVKAEAQKQTMTDDDIVAKLDIGGEHKNTIKKCLQIWREQGTPFPAVLNQESTAENPTVNFKRHKVAISLGSAGFNAINDTVTTPHDMLVYIPLTINAEISVVKKRYRKRFR